MRAEECVQRNVSQRMCADIGPPIKERAKAVVPFLLTAAAYTQWAHLPLEQILNGAIAAVLFNIIYDTLLSRKLRWFALCPVIDSMNHLSASRVSRMLDIPMYSHVAQLLLCLAEPQLTVWSEPCTCW